MPFHVRRCLERAALSLQVVVAVLSLPSSAQNTCFGGKPAANRTIVYQQAVSINTDVLYNTTFYPLPQVAVTVDNAPTSFDGVTTVSWTQTVDKTTSISSLTSSSASSSDAAVSSAPVNTNNFYIMLSQPERSQKRQSGQFYLGSNGVSTNDCSQVPIYTISSNGTLTATVGGQVYTYSTSSGVPYEQFVPSTIPGNITTAFMTGGNAVLNWMNPAFYNGQASFCTVANGTVYAVFAQNAGPDGCMYIQLSLFSMSSCQNLQLTTITGPTGPTYV